MTKRAAVDEDDLLVVPTRGAPCSVLFDGRLRWYWWGSEDHGEDLFAARGPRLLTWDGEAECIAAGLAAGWELDDDQVDDRSASVVDLGPAQDWLARRAPWLDVDAGLGLWNWAVDVSRSTGGAWNPRGRTVDACYRKRFAGDVPYFYGLDSYRPQWTAHQLRALRRVLGEAVHVVRAGCGDLPRRARQKNSSSRR